MFSATFAESSWAEIQAVARSGQASSFWSIGDEKQTSVRTYIIDCHNGNLDQDASISAETLYSGYVRLVAFDGEEVVGSSGHSVVICSSRAILYADRSEGIWDNEGSNASGKTKLRKFLNSHYSDIFPEAANYIKSVRITTRVNNGFGDNDGNYYTTEDFAFPPSANAVGYASYPEEGSAYSYFTSDATRMFKPANGGDQYVQWATRSNTGSGMGSEIRCVNTDGTFYSIGYTGIKWSPLCFCIG